MIFWLKINVYFSTRFMFLFCNTNLVIAKFEKSSLISFVLKEFAWMFENITRSLLFSNLRNFTCKERYLLAHVKGINVQIKYLILIWLIKDNLFEYCINLLSHTLIAFPSLITHGTWSTCSILSVTHSIIQTISATVITTISTILSILATFKTN